MNYNWLIDQIGTIYDSQNISYNSDIEEVIKLLLLSKKENKTITIVKDSIYSANQFLKLIGPFFDEDEIVSYLPEESLRNEEIASSFEIRAAGLNGIYNLISNKKVKIFVTTMYGICRKLPSIKEFEDNLISLKVNDVLSKQELENKLKLMGYERVSHVDRPLTYASRGYIIDVFSVNYNNPIRIEFFDDEIDSLRFFDMSSSSTITSINEATIIFAKDIFFDDYKKNYLKENVEVLSGEMEVNLSYIYNDVYLPNQYFYYSYFEGQSILNYLPEKIVYFSNLDNSYKHLDFLLKESASYIQEMHNDNKLPMHLEVINDYQKILNRNDHLVGHTYDEKISLIESIDVPNNPLNIILKGINNNPHKYKVLFVESKNIEDVVNTLIELNIPYSMYTKKLKEGINLVQGNLNAGFEVNKLDLIVYTQNELYKQLRRVGSYYKQYQQLKELSSYNELEKNDYVVHDKYGIGIFEGIFTKEFNGHKMDYLKVVYAGNEELYIPLYNFSLVRKYVSKDGIVPKLSKLGSTAWKKTKQKAKENIDKLADRLIELYADRSKSKGFAFRKDDEGTYKFASDFEFELTDDQIRAIDEVTADMEKDEPMDRLLCGDVGFGKTEVAVRAAYKAVNSNKQVAYLCPTTILSMQHVNTFKQRFRDLPVRIEILNRFVSNKDTKLILKDLKEGKIDILIGTHKMLNKNVQFKDIGLLIIDEEQRFGVEHKEKIKELKSSIDVLSLSATPIPRTLQMSLVGIRSLSTISKPPLNRYPVSTYVVKKSEGLIREIIQRELTRDGQVFYLYNKVEDLEVLKLKLKSYFPDATIEVVHGQMAKDKIEDIMVDFYQNKINVLVCTTIIETGLDIPNANTLIVEDAQNFGLSQLYQIKGRVGRGDRVAYAYFLIPDRPLTYEGSARLKAIKEFTSLGSGYKIAMRDLAIRGAGDFLGSRQSGFIDNIGFDMYIELLNEAIAERKGIKKEKKETKKLLISGDGYIPKSFTDNDSDKLDLYHKLDKIDNKKDLLKFFKHVNDEYGKVPAVVESLFDKKTIELFYNLKLIDEVKNINNEIVVTISKEVSNQIDGVKFFEYVYHISRDITVHYKDNHLILNVKDNPEALTSIIKIIDNLESLKNENR